MIKEKKKETSVFIEFNSKLKRKKIQLQIFPQPITVYKNTLTILILDFSNQKGEKNEKSKLLKEKKAIQSNQPRL